MERHSARRSSLTTNRLCLYTIYPSPRTSLRKGGHISVPRLEKGPLSTYFSAKKHPFFDQNADFGGTKLTRFFFKTLTFSMFVSVFLPVQTLK